MRHVLKIKNLLLIVFCFLALVFASSSYLNISNSLDQYRQSSRVYSLNAIADNLFQAVRHYGFDRGRTNVVLNNDGPLERMAGNREFILQQRAEGDVALQVALRDLKESHSAGVDNAVLSIGEQFSVVERLRTLAAENMLVTKDKRDLAIASQWFAEMTKLIKSIENLLFIVSRDISLADGVVSELFFLKLKALEVRNTAGPECSMILSAYGTNGKLKNGEVQKIQILQAKTALHLEELERVAQQLDRPELNEALSRFHEDYFRNFVPARDANFEAILEGEPLPIPRQEFTNKMVTALESISGIMDSVVTITSEYTLNQKDISKGVLVQASIMAALFCIVLAYSIMFTFKRVAARIQKMTVTMQELAGDRVVDIPSVNDKDEIGDMARAVEVFRENAIKRREAEEALIVAKEFAEAANKAKSRFLATMSHEIRTPLNGVIGMLQLLDLSDADEEHKSYISLGMSSAKSLLSLINDILDLSKIEADKIDFTYSDFNLGLMLEDLISLFERMSGSKKVIFSCTMYPEGFNTINADKGRLRQIFFNLIGNSAKFTDKGNVDVEVALLGQGHDTRILCAVKDTGVGIPADNIESIFNPFSQTEITSEKNIEGTGLGLAIVRRLVESMKGTICVVSEVGKGTTIYFTIQVSVGAENQGAKQSKLSTRDIVLQHKKKISKSLNILVVEDKPQNQLAIQGLLGHLGHTCLCVTSAELAIETLGKNAFDCILMDIQLPGIDGVEATHRIRATLEEVSSIPIVAMTASAMKGDREKFIKAGMNDYLPKPIIIDDLARVLESLL